MGIGLLKLHKKEVVILVSLLREKGVKFGQKSDDGYSLVVATVEEKIASAVEQMILLKSTNHQHESTQSNKVVH